MKEDITYGGQENQDATIEQLWTRCAERYELSERQVAQCKRYCQMLVEAQQHFNLTAITDPAAMIAYHISDALELGKALDLSQVRMLVDVGTGAGIPGLLLKIKYPHLQLVLIEVTQKKVRFLESVVKELDLPAVTFFTNDWLTFLRTTKLPVDLFTARASLAPAELLRIFQSKSSYKQAMLVYWASAGWEPTKDEQRHLVREYSYKVGDRMRRYIFFQEQ